MEASKGLMTSDLLLLCARVTVLMVLVERGRGAIGATARHQMRVGAGGRREVQAAGGGRGGLRAR